MARFRGVRSVALALALYLAAASDSASMQSTATPRLLVADDYYNARILSEPRLSPDGELVAYLLTVNDRDSDEALSSVWITSWDARQQIALTQPAKGTHALRWSPDGRRIGFLGKPSDSKDQQVIVVRPSGEIETLSHVPGGVTDFAWSPDSRRLVLAIESPKRDDLPKPQPIVIDTRLFKLDGAGYSTSQNEHHLYLLDVGTEELAPLVTEPGFNEEQPIWSPDGAEEAGRSRRRSRRTGEARKWRICCSWAATRILTCPLPAASRCIKPCASAECRLGL